MGSRFLVVSNSGTIATHDILGRALRDFASMSADEPCRLTDTAIGLDLVSPAMSDSEQAAALATLIKAAAC